MILFFCIIIAIGALLVFSVLFLAREHHMANQPKPPKTPLGRLKHLLK